MGLGETERCSEKRKRAGGALRYALIGAREPREVREGRSHKRKKEGARYGRGERGNDFKVIFKVLFFKKNLKHVFWGSFGCKNRFLKNKNFCV